MSETRDLTKAIRELAYVNALAALSKVPSCRFCPERATLAGTMFVACDGCRTPLEDHERARFGDEAAVRDIPGAKTTRALQRIVRGGE